VLATRAGLVVTRRSASRFFVTAIRALADFGRLFVHNPIRIIESLFN